VGQVSAQLGLGAAGRDRYEHVFRFRLPTSHLHRSCVLIINVPQLSRTRSGTDAAVPFAVVGANGTPLPLASWRLPGRLVGRPSRAGRPGGPERSSRIIAAGATATPAAQTGPARLGHGASGIAYAAASRLGQGAASQIGYGAASRMRHGARGMGAARTRPEVMRKGAAGVGASGPSTGGDGMPAGPADLTGWLAAEPRARTAHGRPASHAVIDGSPHAAPRGMHHAGTSQAGYKPVGRRPDPPGIGRRPKGRQ
jgi:hypothetical protein